MVFRVETTKMVKKREGESRLKFVKEQFYPFSVKDPWRDSRR